MMRNLDVTALRSFVAVAESGGVTRAAGFLSLTQSAVSMQLKRLEETLEQRLLDRSARGMSLTPAGAQLLSYAKKIVALNDEAYLRLTEQTWEGEITLGVPYDIINPVVPEVLRLMNRSYPKVRIELETASTRVLKDRFARGDVDVIVGTESERSPGGETLAMVPLRWIGAPGGEVARERPLRLAFCSYCAFRAVATEALDEAALEWDFVGDTPHDRAVEALVQADLAVSAALEGHEPSGLEPLRGDLGLPDLGFQEVTLYAKAGLDLPGQALVDHIRKGFSQARSGAQAVSLSAVSGGKRSA